MPPIVPAGGAGGFFGASAAAVEATNRKKARIRLISARLTGRWSGSGWLTMFASVDTAKRLADVASDPTTALPVREQAIWSLGYRQVRAMHPSTQGTADGVQLADEALYKLADAATTDGKIGS